MRQKWVMQVKNSLGYWISIHPTHDDVPYTFNTREEAIQMITTLYPYETPETVRVAKLED